MTIDLCIKCPAPSAEGAGHFAYFEARMRPYGVVRTRVRICIGFPEIGPDTAGRRNASPTNPHPAPNVGATCGRLPTYRRVICNIGADCPGYIVGADFHIRPQGNVPSPPAFKRRCRCGMGRILESAPTGYDRTYPPQIRTGSPEWGAGYVFWGYLAEMGVLALRSKMAWAEMSEISPEPPTTMPALMFLT